MTSFGEILQRLDLLEARFEADQKEREIQAAFDHGYKLGRDDRNDRKVK
jgi:hypothetical protein